MLVQGWDELDSLRSSDPRRLSGRRNWLICGGAVLVNAVFIGGFLTWSEAWELPDFARSVRRAPAVTKPPPAPSERLAQEVESVAEPAPKVASVAEPARAIQPAGPASEPVIVSHLDEAPAADDGPEEVVQGDTIAAVDVKSLSPDEVLRDRRLSRSGRLYLLSEGEDEVYRAADKTEAACAGFQLARKAYQDMLVLDERVQMGEAQWTGLRQDLDQVVNDIDKLPRHWKQPNSIYWARYQVLRGQENRLRDALIAIDRGLSQLRSQQPTRQQRGEIRSAIDRGLQAYASAAQELAYAVDSAGGNYEALQEDEAVSEALAALRQMAEQRHVKLGPSPRFLRIVKQLGDAKKEIKLAKAVLGNP